VICTTKLAIVVQAVIDPIPLSVQTTYQELLEAHLERSVLGIDGKPELRETAGKHYWYARVRVGDRVITRYVGPDSPELRTRMERARSLHEGQKSFEKRCGIWTAQLRAAGLPALDQASGKIINALAKSGVFRLGGTLVGTHAYRLYDAALGAHVATPSAAITEDVDIASFEKLALAIDDAADPALPGALSELGLQPVQALDAANTGNRWRMSGQGMALDFLTPSFEDEEGIRQLQTLGVTAQSLHFLNYLISEPIPAVAVYRSGVLVQIPRPERFAVHKLIVSQRRPGHQRGKALKDRAQAGRLIEFLSESRPAELSAALEDARAQGPKWRRLLDAAIEGDQKIAKRLSAL
jgi:hypothetical protein